MRDPFGRTRLVAAPALDVWHARTGPTLYAVEPHAVMSVAANTAGLQLGDVAGLALFARPYAWLGLERVTGGLAVAQFDERRGTTIRVALDRERVWLRVGCDFSRGVASFGCSTDGVSYEPVGHPYTIGDLPAVTRGIACALFCCTAPGPAAGGFIDFDSFLAVSQPAPLSA